MKAIVGTVTWGPCETCAKALYCPVSGIEDLEVQGDDLVCLCFAERKEAKG